MSAYIERAEAERLARKSKPRGFMPGASAKEISLPDIGGTYEDICRYSVVPYRLRAEYQRLRSYALAYGDPYWREAEDALDVVLEAKRLHDAASPFAQTSGALACRGETYKRPKG